MPWSDAFKEELGKKRRAPVWIVRFPDKSGFASWLYGASDDYSICTHSGYTDGGGIIASVSTRGSTLDVSRWVTTTGGFSFVVSNWDNLLHLKRGYMCELLLGFEGWEPSAFERISFGRLRSFQIRGGFATLTVDGPLSLLISRQDTTANARQFFSTIGQTTTVAADYTPTDPSIEVAAISGFERQTGGEGTILVEGDGGSDFYLTYTGTGSGPFRFLNLSTADKFNTTQDTAAIGNTVTEYAQLDGHPFDIIAEFLVSSGTGDHGSFDKYPANWAVGLPEEYLATSDLSNAKNRYKSTGSQIDFDILVSGPVDNGLSWLQSYMSTIGVFPTLRQGQFTVRSALDVDNMSTFSTVTLYPDDIVKVEQFSPWDSSLQNVVYGDHTIYTSPSRTRGLVGALKSVPGREDNIVDISGFLFQNTSAQDDIGDAILRRIGTWASRMPGSVTLKLKHWRYAYLCPGDVVTLDAPTATMTFDSLVGMVVSVDPFSGPHTTVTLAIPEPGVETT